MVQYCSVSMRVGYEKAHFSLIRTIHSMHVVVVVHSPYSVVYGDTLVY